jgi:pimeloyl-ACP methyl ester carboxylesterase
MVGAQYTRNNPEEGEAMATAAVNGVNLFYEDTGQGEALILVHGSWGDHTTWDLVVPDLSKRFRVISYDRRGHSRSSAPPGQGRVAEDVADLAALIAHLNAAPAHVAGNSFGASITLRLVAAQPELVRSISAHEPPLFGLLAGDPKTAPALAEVQRRIGAVVEVLQQSENVKAAELFVETVALGPGMWSQLPEERRQVMISNAQTFLDESRDPDGLVMEVGALGRYTRPAQLTNGDQSPPLFPAVLELVAEVLPQAERLVYRGSGHIPQQTDPPGYVQGLTSFLQGAVTPA